MNNKSQGEKVSVYFRADASFKIGTGHVQRCIALAQALHEYGVKCQFITRQDPSELSSQLIKSLFTCNILQPHLTKEEEIFSVCQIIQNPSSTILVLDSYDIDTYDLRQLKKIGVPLVLIDDFAQLPFYDCDLIINQNLFAETLNYATNENTKVLRGPRFALLRREFYEQRQTLKRTHPFRAKRILVTMGGSDPAQGTLKVLKAIHDLDEHIKNRLEITVVLGKAFTDHVKIEAEARQLRNVALIHHSQQMSVLMANTDLSISAGGSTVYELAALGVPSLIVSIAGNQIAVGEALQHKKASVYLGRIEQVSIEEIRQKIQWLLLDRFVRKQLSRQSFKLVDARGADRVARIILEELI
ncbi:UDP-2,4-diacetamido-2,4,6-trideoxy-beta-L-altropy ranose hydrolase [Collibacillus ludicampi]|jgi:UDP-2,4-diacetamido-2,4,6-trideoxy-beta-L-altropyranose hydrolase|uniref:UDP-2,4-diacetamido-2,4, 6-trideoxy-beta-L-altropy ranose hydrolase n=1 Tax=Collibacillus ludicampi TaxID=2771369 RepID=A0AAV4LFE2_9BACL|nr:UDP-2,4-diacetamido-2,4,6-trideoxy-beta-L-altropyranose hydrolase [Collibacillus ludicampi]GIM46478.1 UDP-2,4-diacetamido-2,4,6-trideoxy-beta-L-altropy ranose hydrolase [Collibacillus ludicampi]